MQSTPPTQALHVIGIALRTHNGEAFQTIAPFWGIFRWLLPSSPGGRKSQNFSSSVFTDRWTLTPCRGAGIDAGRHALAGAVPGRSVRLPGDADQWLCGNWLIASGHTLAHQPVFEAYLNSPRGTAPADLLTDIYLPRAL